MSHTDERETGMGKRDTARHLVGPASRALATPARAPRPRLPSLQFGFDEEERSTDSEIANVLGGIGSIPPPNSFDAPVIATSEEAPVPPTSEPPASPLERETSAVRARPAWRAHLAWLDERKLVVITAVFFVVAFVLTHAALFHVIRGR
jgi:hypothetical protein